MGCTKKVSELINRPVVSLLGTRVSKLSISSYFCFFFYFILTVFFIYLRREKKNVTDHFFLRRFRDIFQEDLEIRQLRYPRAATRELRIALARAAERSLRIALAKFSPKITA
jgi:hypothetical protein